MLHAVLAFTISWDPGMKGVLIVATGIFFLIGSVYLLLATNLGTRLGFLVTVAGLFGWMSLMGFVWTMYGIGYKGTAPHWKVEEVVTSESKNDLSAAKLAKAHDLSKWRELAADDPARGDAAAAATAAIAPPAGTESRVKVFESDTAFKIVDAYTIGGKVVSKEVGWRHPLGRGRTKGVKAWVEGWIPGPHPPHYTIIQVQAVEPTPEGSTVVSTTIDKTAPIESVVLVRDLGKLRVPSFLIMCSSLIIFGVACSTLHRRDKAIMAAAAAAA